MRTISTADSRNIAGQLEVGDTVKVTHKNGDTLRFTVEQISRCGISGQGHVIAFDDMRELRVAQMRTPEYDHYWGWILLGLIGVLFATGVLEGQEI